MNQSSQIPYEHYPGTGDLLHFAHANGYLPNAYRQFLEPLRQKHDVLAMRQRPLWLGSDPDDIQDWTPFVEDLQEFYRQHDLKEVITAGHSIGATISLHLALSNPELISKLVLIDPVIFPGWFNRTWAIIYRLGLGYRIHPLARGAIRRRSRFASKDAMFSSYRSKPVFQRLSDASLWDYIDSLAAPAETGGVELAFSPCWEGKIYVTGANADRNLWKKFRSLTIPVLVLRGEYSDTFWAATARRFQRALPQASLITLPETGHLLPLEKPGAVANIILDWLATTGNQSTSYAI